MVSRNHNGADTGVPAGPYRFGYLFPWRVNHTGHADKGHIKLNIFFFVLRQMFQGFHGKSQHSQGFL